MRNIERIIRERHLLKHPFYVAWSCGEVPIETLRAYAGQYYHFERNFPRFVAGAYARIEDPIARRTLLENLVDEEGRDPTHPELWLRFGEAIGASRRSITRATPHRATKGLLETYERFALHGSAPEALGALYAYESIFPEVAAEKARGLRAHYGVRSRRGLEFFRVHTEADVEHSAAERAILRRESARSPDAARSAERATERTIGAWWNFLDAFRPFGNVRSPAREASADARRVGA
ncbi:MAG: CADD family putative folate metabolism protein [Thermoplasmata archaeon]